MDLNKAIEEATHAWGRVKELCPHRNSKRDDEGQGPICEHPENPSGMEWCCPSYCPISDIT